MNLIDCLTDEFYDETKLEEFCERETCSWLEAYNILSPYYAAVLVVRIADLARPSVRLSVL